MKEIDVDIDLRVYRNYRPRFPGIVENLDNPIAKTDINNLEYVKSDDHRLPRHCPKLTISDLVEESQLHPSLSSVHLNRQ